MTTLVLCDHAQGCQPTNIRQLRQILGIYTITYIHTESLALVSHSFTIVIIYN